MLLFLVIGAAVAALFSTGFNRNLLAPVGQNPVLGPLAGILLAQMLCLCSTTDAFIIAAFTPFSIPAKIAFIIAGPLIDLKLYWLYRSAFQARFVHALWLLATRRLPFAYAALFVQAMIDRLARQITFFAPAAVMSAWATVMLHTVATGHINRVLSPMFRDYVLVGADRCSSSSARSTCSSISPADRRSPPTGRLRQLGRWLVLLVPVVAAAILSPSALSSTTMINRGLDSTAGVAPMPSWNTASQKSAQEALDADPNQPVPVQVTDLITLSQKPDQMKAFDGRKVRCIGFIIAQSGGITKLVRGIMWCCAADVQPVSVELTGNITGAYKDTDWFEVTGAAQFPFRDGHIVPTIKVDSVAPTPEPDEPYLSP